MVRAGTRSAKIFGMSRPLAAAVLALLLAAAAGCHAQPTQPARPPFDSEMVALPLGESEVRLAVHTAGQGPSFLVLHDSEDTAAEVGLEAVRARGGRLIEVQSEGRRRVHFEHRGRTWSFDPNRIFTDGGAPWTLREHGGEPPPEVVAEVRRFAEALVGVHGPGSYPVLITLHNNTEGDYSAASYLPGGSRDGHAAALHLPDGADPDDFFFVTDRAIYDALVQEGFPVVLQDPERVEDDGSLSVWAARRGIPYVNVEAQHWHYGQQKRMLEALSRVLDAHDAVRDAAGTLTR